MKIVMAVLLVVIAAMAVAAILPAHRTPPDEITRMRMESLQRRIGEYFAARGALPGMITDLPQEEGAKSGVEDGWGKPIQYVTRDMAVTLLSLGKDGHLGGTGDDADVQLVFTVKGSGAGM